MKRLALVALVVSAPASAHPIRIDVQSRDPYAASVGNADLVAAIRARNSGAIAKLLQAGLDHGALWFPDAACTKRFGKRGALETRELDAFARCLAGLELMPTTRISALPSDVVLTYKPGIEIELGFQRGKLSSVGRDHSFADATPMLTTQVFEALRKSGTTNLDAIVAPKLDPEAARNNGSVSAWTRICLDAKGTATVKVDAASPAAAAAFTAAIADWTFRPFEFRGAAQPACSQSLLVYPAASAPSVEQLPPLAALPNADLDDDAMIDFSGVEISGAPPPPPPPPPQNLPPTLLESLRTSGTKLISPDPATVAEIVKSGKPRIVGSFKLCLTASGTIATVSSLKTTGYPAYDAKLEREMRMWRFRPYLVNRVAVPVCTAETFIYSPLKATP